MRILWSALAIGTMAMPILAQQEQTFERRLSVNGAVDLDVETDAGGILIRTGSGNTVEVRGIGKVNHWEGLFGSERDGEAHLRELIAHPPVEQSGNTIRVGHVRDRNLLRGVSLRLEILTPANSQVRAKADSGGIRIEDVRGRIDARTDSGGIEVHHAGSEVKAGADSGGIRIYGAAGAVDAKADSGGITVNGAGGSVNVSTDSGGIHIEQVKAASIRARADSGGADVRLASDAGYEIDAESESGNIHVRDLQASGTVNRHRQTGRVRGGGPLVHISVQSGHVNID